ncbi:MAG: efflux RND transporter permease subunit [Candidatus Xenobia bacterium]
MNLAAVAMRRPVTVTVAVLAVVLGAVLAMLQMPRDIFPDLGIPVIYVAQPYGGLDPGQMEGFIVNYYEFHFLYISGIEHVESKSIQGVGLVRLQFHPGTNMAQALSETIGYVNRARAFMPPGTVPPFVVRFDAGTVPVGTLVFSSSRRKLSELQDLALFRVRPLFATLPGVSAPPPFGASQRSIVISLDPARLAGYSMSPEEVVTALARANTIAPSGNMRVGDRWPMVPTNGVVTDIGDLQGVAVREAGAHSVFLRDVGTVADASDLTTGYALVNGKRTVYIPVTKRAAASTLAVVNLVKQSLARFQSVLPPDVQVAYQFDQSAWVTRSINGLVLEGALGALLTAVMVLLFLRDGRSVAVVVINIPLSLLAAVLLLWISGQTINLMTLGGLALAVGILVDEATVAVENIHTHLYQGKDVARSARDATAETALPRFLAMLCILAVFIPSFFMTGATRALFVPLALSVGFAMLASFLLSSTLVPILATRWLKPGQHRPLATGAYEAVVGRMVRGRARVVPVYLGVAVMVAVLGLQMVGTEIFPAVDAGQLELRLKAPPGTDLDRTEALAKQALDIIGQEAGPGHVTISLGFVGVQPPEYPINTIYLWTSGPEEAVLQVALRSVSIEPFKERLRERFAHDLPQARVSFEPADIVSRVMSFGALTPIEVDVSGPNLDASRQHAAKLLEAMRGIASLRDLQIVQDLDYPTVQVSVDRERAGELGVTESQVTDAVVAATSSSRFIVPNFWADPKSGIGYQVQVEVPPQALTSVSDLASLPVARGVLLSNLASIEPGHAVGEYDRYNMQRMVTISANIHGADLGHVAAQVRRAVASVAAPRGVTVALRGQVVPLESMLDGLRAGLGLAVVVVLLLLAANFQSWRLALAVMATVPAVLAGVAVALLASGTTLNVQSFMGAIMAVGVAVANSILLVTFAERQRREGAAANDAAVAGAGSRLRPILMTSFAMVAGMLPMALGLGEGGQQTAPLGRAVIGGLLGATLATLLIVPAVFAWVQQRQGTQSASLDPDAP